MNLKERNVLILSFLVLCLCFAAFKFGGSGVVSITGAQAGDCTDTDGGGELNKQLYIYGEVIYTDGKERKDSCSTTSRYIDIIEWQCSADGVPSVYSTTCPGGCKNGACVAECWDHDGADDFFTKSYISYTNSPQGISTEYDICSSDTILAERICVDPVDNSKNVIKTRCPGPCENGKCRGLPIEKPDLIIKNLEFDQSKKSIEFDIINAWNTPVRSYFPIAIYIDDEIETHTIWARQKLGTALVDLPDSIIALEPGESFHKAVGPFYLSSGVHTITVVADKFDEGDTTENPIYDIYSDDMIDEYNENNNDITITIGEPETCTDSDGGKDYSVEGYIEYIPPAGGLARNDDECEADGITLSEFYCENGNDMLEIYTCPEICEDGKCVSAPPPGDCVLTDAYWSESEVEEDDYVDLVVEGSDCDGLSGSFEIFEYNEDDDTSYSISGCVFSGGECREDWKSKYDVEWDLDENGENEFYFNATVDGNVIESDKLIVEEESVTHCASYNLYGCDDYATELKCRGDWCDFDDCRWDDDLVMCYDKGVCGNFICESSYGENSGNCDDCLSEEYGYEWKCPDYGSCVNGKQTRGACVCEGNCDEAPQNEKDFFGKSYTKNCVEVAKFPFFDNFSLIISVLILIGYYLVRKKFRHVRSFFGIS